MLVHQICQPQKQGETQLGYIQHDVLFYITLAY